ncbi:hypothetical protein [Thalassospira xiamenensis]|uniref:hypothetical protein n=1 Tax=Thalassospira xiamenensis TaxID=220697 RepID=UPI0011BE1F3D|nr:hypothetical protein [Thalassospira xiamenensis]
MAWRDWIGLPGSAASGPMVRSVMPKRGSSMAGFVCLPCDNIVALWGEVRFGGQPRSAGVCSGQLGPSGRWRLAMPGAAGWLDWLGG